MNLGKCMTIVLFFQSIFTSNLFAASTTCQFSGILNNVSDLNYNVGVIGANKIYPNGVAAGTPFSVSMTLSGDLGACHLRLKKMA
jgi:hypothetical protein